MVWVKVEQLHNILGERDCFKMLWTKSIVLLEPNMNYWINFVIKLDFGVTINRGVRPITCKREWI